VPTRRIQRSAFGIIAVLLVAVVAAQIVLLRAHPVAHGSTAWSSGASGKCPQFDPETTARCTVVTFAPGDSVGFGFSVRNTGPLLMTVMSVASIGSESPSMLAELHPVLAPVGAPLAIDPLATDNVRPFAPIDLAPGDEAMIYLVGHMRACDAVRGHWGPGTGVRFDLARITIRYLLASTVVEMPLRDVLQIDAPADGQCR
jgi:hypothetical protein